MNKLHQLLFCICTIFCALFIVSCQTTQPVPDNVVLDQEQLLLENELSRSKELASSLNSKYDFLNYSRLETVSVEKTDLIPRAYQNADVYIYGYYSDSENKIYIVSNSQTEQTMLHEMMHALTYNDNLKKYNLQEGVADYLAYEISKENDLDFQIVYPEQAAFVNILCHIFGDETAIQMLVNGELETYVKKYAGEEYITPMLNYLEQLGSSDELTSQEKKDVREGLLDIAKIMYTNYAKTLPEDEQQAYISQIKEIINKS